MWLCRPREQSRSDRNRREATANVSKDSPRHRGGYHPPLLGRMRIHRTVVLLLIGFVLSSFSF